MASVLHPVLLLLVSSVLPAQQNVFTNVGLLQKATTPVLPPVGWKDLGSGLGFYGSNQILIAEIGFVPSTLKYSISGNTRNRVDEVLISVFIASPKHLATGKSKLQAAAALWFKSVGKAIPVGLAAAINAGRSFRSRDTTGGLLVEYVVARGMGSLIKQPDGSSYRCTTMDLKMGPL